MPMGSNSMRSLCVVLRFLVHSSSSWSVNTCDRPHRNCCAPCSRVDPSVSSFALQIFILFFGLLFVHTHKYIHMHTHTHIYVFMYCNGAAWLLSSGFIKQPSTTTATSTATQAIRHYSNCFALIIYCSDCCSLVAVECRRPAIKRHTIYLAHTHNILMSLSLPLANIYEQLF